MVDKMSGIVLMKHGHQSNSQELLLLEETVFSYKRMLTAHMHEMMVMSKGTTEKTFRVPAWNQTYDLHNACNKDTLTIQSLYPKTSSLLFIDR